MRLGVHPHTTTTAHVGVWRWKSTPSGRLCRTSVSHHLSLTGEGLGTLPLNPLQEPREIVHPGLLCVLEEDILSKDRGALPKEHTFGPCCLQNGDQQSYGIYLLSGIILNRSHVNFQFIFNKLINYKMGLDPKISVLRFQV